MELEWQSGSRLYLACKSPGVVVVAVGGPPAVRLSGGCLPGVCRVGRCAGG